MLHLSVVWQSLGCFQYDYTVVFPVTNYFFLGRNRQNVTLLPFVSCWVSGVSELSLERASQTAFPLQICTKLLLYFIKVDKKNYCEISVSNVIRLKCIFFLLRQVMSTDVSRFMYITTTALAIIFNQICRRVSFVKQSRELLLGCFWNVPQWKK